MSRSTTTEAVVLRSFRLGEADRVLHVYTSDQGRVGAVAKGVRKPKSRFGGRLEPFSHVELVLHRLDGVLEAGNFILGGEVGQVYQLRRMRLQQREIF